MYKRQTLRRTPKPTAIQVASAEYAKFSTKDKLDALLRSLQNSIANAESAVRGLKENPTGFLAESNLESAASAIRSAQGSLKGMRELQTPIGRQPNFP